MTVFEKLSYSTEKILDQLIDELIDIQFLKDLSFVTILDQDGETPHIDFYIEGNRAELDEYFFSLYFDPQSKEFYYWDEIVIGDIEITAKVFIQELEQIIAVLNDELEKF